MITMQFSLTNLNIERFFSLCDPSLFVLPLFSYLDNHCELHKDQKQHLI